MPLFLLIALLVISTLALIIGSAALWATIRNRRRIEAHDQALNTALRPRPDDGGRRLRRVAAILAPLTVPFVWVRAHPRQAVALTAATVAGAGIAVLLTIVPRLGNRPGPGALPPTSPPTASSSTMSTPTPSSSPNITPTTGVPPASRPPAAIVGVPHRPRSAGAPTTATAPGVPTTTRPGRPPTTTTVPPPSSTRPTRPACLIRLHLSRLDLCVR